MKRKEILLVVALVAFGLLYQAVEKGRVRVARDLSFYADDRRPKGTRFSEFPGGEASYDGVSRVVVANPAGEVVVGPSADGRVRFTSRLRVYHSGARAPENAGQEARARGDLADGTLKVSVAAPSPFPYRRLRVLLRLELPAGVPLEIFNQEGDVIVRGTAGELSVEQKNGDLVLESIAAPARLRIANGGARIRDLAGAVDIRALRAKVFLQNAPAVQLDGRHGEFILRGVAGLAKAEMAYGRLDLDGAGRLEVTARHGRIRAAHVRQGAVVDNKYEPTFLEDLGGDVRVSSRSGKIDIRRVSGGAVVVENSYADVDVSGFSGSSLDVSLKDGRLVLRAERVDERVNVNGSHADVDLFFSALADPTFSIKAVHGRISAPARLGLESYEEKEESFANRDGGKPQILVHTVYGNVKVDAGG